jgi:hypothetical protein
MMISAGSCVGNRNIQNELARCNQCNIDCMEGQSFNYIGSQSQNIMKSNKNLTRNKLLKLDRNWHNSDY